MSKAIQHLELIQFWNWMGRTETNFRELRMGFGRIDRQIAEHKTPSNLI